MTSPGPVAFVVALATLVLAGASPLMAATPEVPFVPGQAEPDVSATSSCGTTKSLSFGHDGRLTVLLMGTDYRRPSEVGGHYLGERTDVMIVATLKSGRVSFAAIPRDTVQVPLANGGTSGTSRINELYMRYKHHGYTDKVDCSALDHVRRDVATTLQTEIDYYAMVRFHTFEALMQEIHGVTMDIKEAVIDDYLKGGLYFPKANDYFLGDGKAQTNCHPKPFRCHSALLYARSRHGTQGNGANSDYSRARRQMDLIMAAAARPTRAATAATSMRWWTSSATTSGPTCPRPPASPTSSTTSSMTSTCPTRTRSSSGPASGPTATASTPGYTFRLRLPLVRSWINDHFGS